MLHNTASQHDRACCSIMHDRVQHDTMSRDAPTCNHEQRSPAHHNTSQCSPAQHSTAQHSTAQHTDQDCSEQHSTLVSCWAARARWMSRLSPASLSKSAMRLAEACWPLCDSSCAHQKPISGLCLGTHLHVPSLHCCCVLGPNALGSTEAQVGSLFRYSFACAQFALLLYAGIRGTGSTEAQLRSAFRYSYAGAQFALLLCAGIRGTRLIDGSQSNCVARPCGARMIVISGTGVNTLLGCCL